MVVVMVIVMVYVLAHLLVVAKVNLLEIELVH